jgi:hypothetical protein
MVVVAMAVVLLALPLVIQTYKSAPGYRATVALRSMPIAESAVEVVPVTPESSEPAVLTHTYDVQQKPFVAEPVVEAFPATSEPVAPEPPQPAVMTRLQFDRINSGMTYEQCVQFIGCEGEYVGPKGTGEEYAWQLVDGSVSSGEATLTFQNGILNGKGFHSNQGQRGSYEAMMAAALPAQRPAAPPYICGAVYNSLTNGCAYKECVRQLGMEGSYLGSRAMSGGTRAADGSFIPAMADVFVWNNPSNRTTLTLSFRDGRLTGREISKSN